MLNMEKLPRREEGAELGVERGRPPSLFGEDSVVGDESALNVRRRRSRGEDSSTHSGVRIHPQTDLSSLIQEIAGAKDDGQLTGSRSRSYWEMTAALSDYTTALACTPVSV